MLDLYDKKSRLVNIFGVLGTIMNLHTDAIIEGD